MCYTRSKRHASVYFLIGELGRFRKGVSIGTQGGETKFYMYILRIYVNKMPFLLHKLCQHYSNTYFRTRSDLLNYFRLYRSLEHFFIIWPYNARTCKRKTYFRAVNTEGKWRIIVNGVNAHYETLTQTARVEECETAGSACPLVPDCYPTKCVQKSIYHRYSIKHPCLSVIVRCTIF